MPRTRNVTRTQWDLVNATNSTTTGDQKRNHDCESEKENEARPGTRATRSQTRTRSKGNRVVFGSITITSKGPENTASANTSKAKGKGKGKDKAPPPKRKKLPLQDITSHFLPAPEATNRGEDNEAVEDDIFQQTENRVNLVSALPLARDLGGATLGLTMSMNHPAPTYLDSPLPPSSPPSAITSSPQHPKILSKLTTSWLSLPYGEETNLWNEFDDVRHSQGNLSAISSISDPFGFVALERKLKVERRAAAPFPLKRLHHQDESDEELGQILVADTSSPRLVRRLKRPLYQDDSTLPPAISEHPHYATPPTPHKDKKRQRLSHEGDSLYSFSSSIPSTPSPSKPSTQKRAQEAGRENALEELKYNLNGNREVEDIFRKTKNRTRRGLDKDEQSKVIKASLQVLLGVSLDGDADTKKEQANPTNAKGTKSKKIPKKSRSTGTKKEKAVGQNDGGGDCAEKWERERQERVTYFKRLEGYQVQKEDVYVI